MLRRRIYAPRARADLDAARRWLTQPGAWQRARRTLAAIRADIRRLQQNPCRWPVGEHLNIRELPCAGGWRVLYEITPYMGSSTTAGDVLVLRIYGPGQDRGGFRPAA